MTKRAVFVVAVCVSSVLVAQEKTRPKFDWKNVAPPSTRWKQVRVTSDARAADGCKSVGSVYAKLYRLEHREVTSDMVYDELKKSAAEKEANLVVLIGPATQVGVTVSDKRMEASGEAYMCASSDPIGQAIGEACDANFAVETALWKESTYKTNAPYPTLNKTALMRRLLSAASEHELTVLESAVAGVAVTAEVNAPRNKKLTYAFAISDEGPGSRVEVIGKLPGVLNKTQNDELRSKLCAFLTAIGSASASAAAEQPTTTSVIEKSSVEQRLKNLEDLYKKKVISKEEYDKKRAAILKDL